MARTATAKARNKAKRDASAKTKQNQGGGVVRAPRAQNMSSGSSRSRGESHTECERFTTIDGSVAFASAGNFALNPGLSGSFPWLSKNAKNYERYRFKKLLVRYKNLKGADTAGNVIVSFDPDTLDSGPTTAIEQTQSYVYCDGAPWRIFERRIPCDSYFRFIRSADIAGADLKTYDMGRIWVSTEGCADTSTLGYLEFEYEVELIEKQSSTGTSAPVNRSVSIWNLASDTSGLSASAVLDISEEVAVASYAAPTNSSGTLTLPIGNWIVRGEFTFAANANSTCTVEIRSDGSSLTIPVKAGCQNNVGSYAEKNSGSLTAFITSDGTTTVDMYFNYVASATTIFYGDMCRLIVQSV